MWHYNNEEYQLNEQSHKEVWGFVYLIENLMNGKKYIGKKQFFSMNKKKPLKGKTRRRIVYKESDWKSYYGSNEELQNEVITHGEENFKRTILHLCYSKSECSYLELHEQVIRNVLLSDDYYNAWIQVKIRKAHLKKYADKCLHS